MAGMLAGVESARRRRIHQNIVSSSFSSPPTCAAAGAGAGASLCLRRSLFFHTSSPCSPSSVRSRLNQGQVDEKLGQLARQAKERLDERLRAQSKPLPTRNTSCEVRVESGGNRNTSNRTESTGKKQKKKKGWGMLGGGGGGGKTEERWKHRESECVICLEEISREEEEVIKLECSHTFHTKCVIPWLHSHPICPCCRTPTS